MGYYTRYSLKYSGGDDVDLRRCKHLFPEGARYCPECGESTSPMSVEDAVNMWYTQNPGGEGYDDIFNMDEWDSCKWYDHEKDMRKVSAAFPSILFQLDGEGEESGDIWREWYLGGKMQREKVEIKFNPFDPDKLK